MRRGILATGEELSRLASRVEKRPFDEFLDHLERRCALILESRPISEGQWRSIWSQGKKHAAVTAAQAAQGRILDLLIADAIETNRAYRARAKEELASLLGWSTWHDPSHTHSTVDLCTAEAAVAVVLALDWLWDSLSESARRQAVETVKQKAIEPYLKAVKAGEWWYSCYHSWNAVVNGGCGLAGLALGDQDEQAQRAHQRAVAGIKHFQDALSSDGGWDEGPAYWGYGFRYLLLLAEGMTRLDDDQRLYHHRGMDQTGLFPIYFSPNGRSTGFGEAPGVPLYGALYLLEKRLDCKAIGWWLDTYSFHRDLSTMSWSAAGLAILCRGDSAKLDPPKLEPVKTFEEIGWGAMADNWPRPDFYASLKTGDLAANHAQRDMNSLQLQVDGETLLIDPDGGNGSADYSETTEGGSAHAARAHNTLTVAEEDHRIDARGRIVKAHSDKRYRWMACDAGEALGEGVRFIRHAVMLLDDQGRGESLLVLDEVILGVPEKVEAFWHTTGQLHVDAEKMIGRIEGRQAEINLALGATCNIRVWSRTIAGRGPTAGQYLHVAGGVPDRALLATLFTRREISSPLTVDQDLDRAVVRAAEIEVRFKTAAHHLQLDL